MHYIYSLFIIHIQLATFVRAIVQTQMPEEEQVCMCVRVQTLLRL